VPRSNPLGSFPLGIEILEIIENVVKNFHVNNMKLLIRSHNGTSNHSTDLEDPRQCSTFSLYSSIYTLKFGN
jgi:hypothetical protein